MKKLGRAISIFAVTAFCYAASAQTALAKAGARELLETMQTGFEQRPAFEAAFKGEYRLASGQVGRHASQAETATGKMLVERGRVLMTQVDVKWDEREQRFVPVRDERSAWIDGRRVGLRRFLDTAGHEQPFTNIKKYHDAVRPDIHGWFADGIIYDTEHFSTTLLRCADLRATKESLALRDAGVANGKVAVVRFEGTCPEGTMEAWVTDDEQHLLVKATFIISEAFAKTLGDIRAASIDVNSVDYADVDGNRFPIRGEAFYTYDIPSDGVIKKGIVVTRTSYRLNPEPNPAADYAFELAEGIEVLDYDDVSVKWEWRGGELNRLP